MDPQIDRLRTIGLIAALTGNKQLGGAGGALTDLAQQQQQYALQAPHVQAQTAELQQKVAAGQRAADAENNPLAGQAFLQTLKGYGYNLPEGTPTAVLRNILPVAERGDAAKQARQARIDAAKIAAGAKIATSGFGTGNQSVEGIGDAIISGQQPPDLKGLYRFSAPLKAYLAKQGFDLSSAQQEWTATQKHLATMNGQQQERLRQAVDFTSHSLDTIQNLYDDWKAVGAQSGIKAFNRASLAVAKNLPGDAGAAAQALEAQIGDLTAELGNVYMGGNSPTDHALQLASKNLSADWNEQTFKKALDLIRTNLKLRQNAMNQSNTAGGSRYDKQPVAPSAATAQPQGAAPDAAALRKKYGL